MRAAGAWTAALALAALAAAGAPGSADAEARLEARLSRTTVAVGEATTLQVTVSGAGGGIGDPELALPDGVEVLSSGRSSTFEWIDGRSSSRTVFRYELTAERAGRFTLGPVRVRVGRQTLVAGALELVASAAPSRIGPAGGGPAALRVDVDPPAPYVGQPVRMRVRLVLRAAHAEEPQYVPPATPGFWAEAPSAPESYYAQEGEARVLVTETRTRLYPLASGTATVGEAAAVLALVVPGADDPALWLGGRVPRREVSVRSAPVAVRVRALPDGAPPAFDGAVGGFTVTWSADRATTSRDVPFTVRLDVRGIGNLPLIHTPPFDAPGCEVFGGGVEDSLGLPGSDGPGRRRFVWTVLPRGEGVARVPAPAFAWFDPAAGGYRGAAPAPVEVRVGPALHAGETPAGFPRVFAEHPADPGGRRAAPWAGALAGLALGAAWALWRSGARPAPDAAERARRAEWLRAVGLAHGPDFWRAADEAAGWLEGRGLPAQALRRDIAAARYAGEARAEEPVRRRVVEMLGRALPPPHARGWVRAAAVALGSAGAALAILLGPWPGPSEPAARSLRADQAAREGDVAAAAREWEALWDEGAQAPALAARLSWAEARAGRVGRAAAWVLRGRACERRDGALAWAAERVREAGGLVGDPGAVLPVRRLEWAVLALLAGLAAGVAWSRRWPAAVAVTLALAAAAAAPAEDAWVAARRLAVARDEVPLAGAEVTLEPGQVVRLLASDGRTARVSAGRGAEGEVPVAALEPVQRGMP